MTKSIKKLDMKELRKRKHKTVSLEESLKDITPIQWSNDVLNGTKAQFEFNTNKEFDNYEVHGEYNISK